MSDRPGEYQTSQPFEYVVGGSLPLDAVSYVKRSADDEFFAGLKAGKFCYVLNSRQMGKSSLRVRTMARLQADGVVCVSIDMTAIGSAEVTAEQWYLGVLWAIVKQVQEQTTALADWKLPALRSWWVEREGLSFVQRWGEFIEVLLGEVGERVVIFVDEIDSVLGLGFRADDFFAAIRECYNRRVDEPQYDRLTFTLLGVCAPQDLIQDKHRTPFNIGQAIELLGFSYEEAISLAKGLPGGASTLRSILDWTGGQPFLTQRVCRLVREEMPPNPQCCGDMSVDEIVQSRIIRVWESQDEQVHFQTIGDRMMADEALAGAMLGMYQRVLAEGSVGIDGSAEQIALRLTGVVVKRGNGLCVMNRIYEGVFGREWVSGKLEALRPYGEELRSWLNTNDSNFLLDEDSLKKAREWAEKRKLSSEDYVFIVACYENIMNTKLSKIVQYKEITEKAMSETIEAMGQVKDCNKQILETQNQINQQLAQVQSIQEKTSRNSHKATLLLRTVYVIYAIIFIFSIIILAPRINQLFNIKNKQDDGKNKLSSSHDLVLRL